MRTPSLLLLSALALLPACGGVEAIKHFPDSGLQTQGSTRIPLTQATGALLITVDNDSDRAKAQLVVLDAARKTVELSDGQEFRVNDVVLVAKAPGSFEAEIAAASSYVLRVKEPSFGVSTTTIASPGAFQFPATDLSLSGGTLTWTQPERESATTIRLAQTFQGEKSATFEQAEDKGSLSLTVNDLADFVQGKVITVSVSKSRKSTGIQGMASGGVQASRTRTNPVTPQP